MSFSPQHMSGDFQSSTPLVSQSLFSSTPTLSTSEAEHPLKEETDLVPNLAPPSASSQLAPVIAPSLFVVSLNSAECSGIVATLHNVVCTVNLGCKLDLPQIAVRVRNAEYNPKRFSAVIMKIREPRSTALIFGSGKMVCAGTKSIEHARLAARKYARIAQKLGFEAKFLNFTVQNMMATCDLKFPIRLEEIIKRHPQFSDYEPELFPGVIFRMFKPRVVFLIFVSGKVVVTGAKNRNQIDEAMKNIYPMLREFRKT